LLIAKHVLAMLPSPCWKTEREREINHTLQHR